MASMGAELHAAPATSTSNESDPLSREPGAAPSVLEEAADSFVVRAVRSPTDETRATVVWRKQAFGDWWRSARVEFPEIAPAEADRFTLPAIVSGDCVNDSWKPTFQEVPDPRAGHTAVWTGAEMIVWGGGINYGLNTGGRYDPVTDTWTMTSIGAGVPHARSGHRAVWTGTEMIVWGGSYSEGTPATVYPTSGGRYDPSTDTWIPTSTGANVPTGRYGHTAVWTGTEMVIWGGAGSGGYLNTGARYDPPTDTWASTSIGANVPPRRLDHTAVWTGAEMIVWGGSVIGPDSVSGGRYDPLLDRWLPTSTVNVPTARAGHSAIWTGTQMIVWGGRDLAASELTTGARYDPILDQWTPTSVEPSTPTAREGHAAVWTGTEMVVWGGTGPFGGGSSRNTGGRYDPSTDHWLPTSTGLDVPPARLSFSAVWSGTEMIIWGGWSEGSVFGNGGRYDPSQDRWMPITLGGSVPSAREEHTLVWTGNEMIVWGGWDGMYGAHNDGGRYQPATDSWIPTSIGANVPSPRSQHAGVWTGTRMIIWGGNSGSTASGGSYDPITDSWTPTATAGISARSSASVTWTGRDMLVWGGSPCTPTCSGLTNTGARYDPEADTWTPTSTGANAPSARSNHIAVVSGGELIVWGGFLGANTYTNTGARYDLVSGVWTPISTSAGVPPARGGYRGVATPSGMIVWGDGNYPNRTNTGARYDAALNQWSPTSTAAGTPSGRDFHAAVWTGKEMIVWAGQSPQAVGSSGGRYDPLIDLWTPTSLASAPGPRFRADGVWTGSRMLVWGGSDWTSTGGAYCACPDGRLVYRDADGDGYGDPGFSTPSCDGAIPAGQSAVGGDCNDGSALVHPEALEACNGVDDDCDGLIDEDASGVDADGDGVLGACDNCPLDAGRTQSDRDHDGEGDICDLDDGEIWERRDDKTSVSWQAEQGASVWNVYVGDLAVLKKTGEYTQAPESSPLASRTCGATSTIAPESSLPDSGEVSFSLVTGVAGGVEGSRGSGSSGPRPNAHPCP